MLSPVPCTRFERAVVWLVMLLVMISLGACGNEAAEQQAAAAAKAKSDADAAAFLPSIEKAEADGRPDLARAFADDLLSKHPASPAAEIIKPRIEALRKAADAEIERRRLRALWTYHDVDDTEATGKVRTAFLYATESVAGEAKVRLVLRRHHSWGQSAYLLITDGDFACQGKCDLQMRVDGGESKPVQISRAEGNVPPAVFIEGDVDFLAQMQKAKRLEMLIKLAPARPTKFEFEVAGFDLEKLGPEVSGTPPAAGG
ncbi:MAG: hypothetical protein ACT4NL_02410 [Pseudomarimonas sp.]